MRFDDFWRAWPSNTATYTRKGGKAECLRRWTRRGLDAEADHIIAHVQWLKTTEQWTKAGGEFIPAPLSYINQTRWDGAEIPESAEQAKARREAIEQRLLRESIEAAGMTSKPTVRRVA